MHLHLYLCGEMFYPCQAGISSKLRTRSVFGESLRKQKETHRRFDLGHLRFCAFPIQPDDFARFRLQNGVAQAFEADVGIEVDERVRLRDEPVSLGFLLRVVGAMVVKIAFQDEVEARHEEIDLVFPYVVVVAKT